MKQTISKISLIAILVVFAVTLTGCGKAIDSGDSTVEEMKFTEKNHRHLRNVVPEPKLEDSLERRNLVKYLLYWNDQDRLSYIYLMSRSGTVIGHYVIKGKVTYCSSKLTTRNQICEVGGYRKGAGYTRHIIESPGLDGSYGPSEDAIFFFTVENPDVPVVWKGDYLVSGVPMNITTKPVLVRTIE